MKIIDRFDTGMSHIFLTFSPMPFMLLAGINFAFSRVDIAIVFLVCGVIAFVIASLKGKFFIDMVCDSQESCIWEGEPFGGDYKTKCGNRWQFIDGGIEDNNISYCPYCGRHILHYDTQGEE